MNKINLDIDISHQALAVQAGLKTQCWGPLQARIQMYPLFNGRERGLCLEVRHQWLSDQALLVSFGEHRNTEDLFVQMVQTTRILMNGPELEDFTEESYRDRKHFGNLDIASVVEHIYNEVEAYVLKREQMYRELSL